VKVHNPPGGKSNFSLGFEEAPSYKQPALKNYDMNKGNNIFGGAGYQEPQRNAYMQGGKQDSYGNGKASQGYGMN